MTRRHRLAARRSPGFTLVEVTIALGLLAFSLTALMGLMTVGLRTQAESADDLHAAHLLAAFLAERTAMPLLELPENPLPKLDVDVEASASGVNLDASGNRLPAAEAGAKGHYRFYYEVKAVQNTPPPATSPTRRLVRVRALLLWPPQPEGVPYAQALVRAQGRQESITYVRLP